MFNRHSPCISCNLLAESKSLLSILDVHCNIFVLGLVAVGKPRCFGFGGPEPAPAGGQSSIAAVAENKKRKSPPRPKYTAVPRQAIVPLQTINYCTVYVHIYTIHIKLFVSSSVSLSRLTSEPPILPNLV